MPKLEPKQIQKELDQGWLWPVYWLYGHERMKARELLKRIKKTALSEGGDGAAMGSLMGFAEETLDATEVDSATVLDAAQSQALGGGLRVIIIREAHALKDADRLAPLLGPKAKADALTSVCIFLSKDLDARKKFSKLLIDQAAVVPCEEVPETDREAWISYLAKRRGLELPPEVVPRLAILDPWGLDIIDQELEKFVLAGGQDSLLMGTATGGGGDAFLDAFFRRDLKAALSCAESFADRPDESLPLLGLLGWNVRHLALLISDRERGTRTVKLNPYVAERMQRWSQHWTLSEILAVQGQLEELDFSLKQTPLLPLGLWGDLIVRFCRV